MVDPEVADLTGWGLGEMGSSSDSDEESFTRLGAKLPEYVRSSSFSNFGDPWVG